MPAFCMCIIKGLGSGAQHPPGSARLFSDLRKEPWELFSSIISRLLDLSCYCVLSLLRYPGIPKLTKVRPYKEMQTEKRMKEFDHLPPQSTATWSSCPFILGHW